MLIPEVWSSEILLLTVYNCIKIIDFTVFLRQLRHLSETWMKQASRRLSITGQGSCAIDVPNELLSASKGRWKHVQVDNTLLCQFLSRTLRHIWAMFKKIATPVSTVTYVSQHLVIPHVCRRYFIVFREYFALCLHVEALWDTSCTIQRIFEHILVETTKEVLSFRIIISENSRVIQHRYRYPLKSSDILLTERNLDFNWKKDPGSCDK